MPEYSSPALEKGLDVLELLAETAHPIGQSEIAAALGRSIGELFRVLQTLERRGFIYRDRGNGLYLLSTRLLELSGRQPPLRALLLAASAPMSRLSRSVRQSCNLAVLDGTDVRVVAQQESPADFGFRVRVGATFPATTATGVALLAFSPDDRREAILSDLPRGSDVAALRLRLDEARKVGFETAHDARSSGIVDIATPVLGRDQTAIAALTIPYVDTSYSGESLEATIAAVRQAGAAISATPS